MELIRKLGTKTNKSGNLISYGEFLCPNIECNKIIIRNLSNGKRQKSCGCQKYSKDRNTKVALAKKNTNMPEETKQKIRETMINKEVNKGKNNPMYGKSGELSPQWNNGSSFKPYSPEFNKQLKQQILERDNYECQNLNCEQVTNKLDIHHIDYNKENNSLDNFITLCDSCHGKSHPKNNRTFWILYYQNILINRIVECLL